LDTLKTAADIPDLADAFEIYAYRYAKGGPFDKINMSPNYLFFQVNPGKPLPAASQWAAQKHPKSRNHFTHGSAVASQDNADSHNHHADISPRAATASFSQSTDNRARKSSPGPWSSVNISSSASP